MSVVLLTQLSSGVSRAAYLNATVDSGLITRPGAVLLGARRRAGTSTETER